MAIKNELKNEEFQKFIENLKLVAISVEKIRFEAKDGFSPPASVSLNRNTSYKMKNSEKKEFVLYHTFHLTANKKGKKQPGLELEISYRVLYKNSVPITDEIFKIFGLQSYVLHTWPYVRQFVQDLTVRAGLPPLTLDVIPVTGVKNKPESEST